MPRALRTPRFGAWLRKQRGANTLEEFAIKVRKHAAPLGLELDRSQIAKTEAGRIPSVPILMALARVLDVSPSELQMRIVAELRGEGWIDLLRRGSDQVETVQADESGNAPTDSEAAHGGHAAGRQTSTEDQELLNESVSVKDLHAIANLATTRAAFERVVGELAALVRQLPRGSVAVARAQRSGDTARPARHHAKHGRKHQKKPARD